MKTKLGEWCAVSAILFSTACGGLPTDSRTEHVATFRGPPDVRFRTTGELKRADLVRGLPAWRIEGPHDLVLFVALFDDVDRDGIPSTAEPRSPVSLRPLGAGLGIDPESIGDAVRRDFEKPTLFVEFVLGGQRQTYSRSIE